MPFQLSLFCALLVLTACGERKQTFRSISRPPIGRFVYDRGPEYLSETPELRKYTARGEIPLKTLYSTDGAYLALFSFHDYHLPAKPGIMLTVFKRKELRGEFYVDVFRRRDGAQVAALQKGVFLGNNWSSHGPAIDSPAEWARHSGWYRGHALVVPFGYLPDQGPAEIAELPHLPGWPLPFGTHDGLSFASGDLPRLSITARHDEAIRDRQGRIETVIVHLTAEPELAGMYRMANRDLLLHAGPQELTFALKQNETLTSLAYHFNSRGGGFDEGSANVPAAPPPSGVWSSGPPRRYFLVPGSAAVQAGPPIEIKVELVSTVATTCHISAILHRPYAGSFGDVTGKATLQPGSNLVSLHAINLRSDQLYGGPHELSIIQLNCQEVEGQSGDSLDLADFSIPTIDLSGISSAKCASDYNDDGRVDELDVTAFIKSRPPVPASVAQVHRQTVRKFISSNQGCRIR